MISYFLKKCKLYIFLFSIVVLLIVPKSNVEGGNSMDITSTAFNQGEEIPQIHTCDGSDISPPLSWTGTPEGAKSFALICDDPDAPVGTWVHWVIYNMPAPTTQLSEAVQKTEVLANGARQGMNDFRRIGYGGPCPPPGHGYHRYFFKLYALDTMLDIKSGRKIDVLRVMDGHILAEAKLMGKYKR
jgi:Raf kinase inhibitor-like YbhB/YbcL family protein